VSRVLVIGGMGMLGHQLVRQLGQKHSVGATIRDAEPPSPYPIPGVTLFTGVDVTDDAKLVSILSANWDVVVNAAGMIKQRPDCADPVHTIAINSLLPHRLAAACRRYGARLIHFSTDCVFSGAAASQRGPAGYRVGCFRELRRARYLQSARILARGR